MAAYREKISMDREIHRVPTVLVVDDEALIRWALTEALSAAGYSTIQAATGAETLTNLAENGDRPLVVLLDLRLSDVHDLSLVRDVRRLRPDAPLIVMTAHGTVEDAEQVLAAGAVAFLTKPFDMTDAVGAVDRAWRAA
jgi:two-component system nitrogen regulation response regulator GlnG